MYDPITGAWIANANEKFEEHFETTYYLKYNIEKALYSLDKILMKKIDYSEFTNRCAYYHFYIDSLFNAVGHIRRRFYNENICQDRIERNRSEYNYCAISTDGSKICNYPVIGNDKVRNFVEHIDEKDEVLIDKGLYNGTFNVIYNGMNLKTKKELQNDERKQNNLLNLITKEYKVLNIDTKTKEVHEYRINLMDLKKELENLKGHNDSIWGYMTEKFWK